MNQSCLLRGPGNLTSDSKVSFNVFQFISHSAENMFVCLSNNKHDVEHLAIIPYGRKTIPLKIN